MQSSKISWVVLVALGVVACGQSSGDSIASGLTGASSGDAGAASCSDLTYDTFGEAFLGSYCVSCHGSTLAQNRVRLDSLANLDSNKSKAKSQVANGSMPPRGASAPSSAERTMFSEWIACGAN